MTFCTCFLGGAKRPNSGFSAVERCVEHRRAFEMGQQRQRLLNELARLREAREQREREEDACTSDPACQAVEQADGVYVKDSSGWKLVATDENCGAEMESQQE